MLFVVVDFNTTRPTSPLDYCSENCPISFLNEKECLESCNNYLCGYDKGNCESTLTSDDKCYGGGKPGKQSYLDACEKFKESSCCSEAEAVRVNSLYNAIMASVNSGCKISTKCLSSIEEIICAPCSPENKLFISHGNITYCSAYAAG